MNLADSAGNVIAPKKPFSLATILSVALAYAIVAKLSFCVTIPPGNISPIFPAAGIALAAVMISGRNALIGVWLGSFAINTLSFFDGTVFSGHAVWVALLAAAFIGMGAMSGAGIGSLLVRRLCKDTDPLHSGWNVLMLVTVGAIGCCMLSPTLGVLSLRLGGYIPWDGFGYSWMTWWVGDAVGALIVAPLILAWHYQHHFQRTLWRTLEATVLGAATLLICYIVFFQHAHAEYLLLPMLLWAAFRFGMRGASTAGAFIAIFATIGTCCGESPFVGNTVNESLLRLHSFLGVTIVCSLFLAGILAERKRTEEALRQSESTLRSVLRAVPIGISIMKNRVFESANNYWCETLGYPEKSIIGQGTRMLYDSDEQWQQVGRDLYARLQEKGLASVETTHRCHDGSSRDVIVTVAPIHADDSVARTVAVIYDITERKQAERKLEQYRQHLEEMVEVRTAELRMAKEQLEAIFQSVNVGIAVVRDRIIRQCNPRLDELFGYEIGELAGQPTRLWYISETDYEMGGKSVYEQIWRGEVHRREQQFRRKDGGLFWVRLSGRALDVNDPSKGLVAVLEDITAEREAAESLRLAAAEQQAIFESATSGIVLVKNRIISHCNRKMDELFGYAAGEMDGQTTRGWYPDDATYHMVGKETADCLANGRLFQREQQLVRKDGSRFWGQMTAQAADKTDLDKGLVGIIDDITAERMHEESLRLALERAEAADRLKSAFLATMSHELRTPLNSIIGFTGILLQGLTGPLNQEQRKQLGMVQNSSRHLLALINDVLDISKIEAGQLEVKCAPFDLRESITKVASLVQPLAEKKGLALRVVLTPEIGQLESDARRVEQVLLNLVNNAIKFTDHGTVTLSAHIVQEARPVPSTTLRIAVADTGIGIKPQDLNQLFLPFRQIDSGLARQHEGTGLGLAICRRLADLLGGDVQATSEWGKGSVFTFSLPMKGPAES